ncbi:MAG: HNH endonuclease [Planctomycetales bacterium]|nr:HNH endonuclease [Planctomycetales bacterium]
MDRSKYPDDWDEIALRIKTDAGWKCEQCGRQCRFPDEVFDTHVRTLTVAHINHVEMDCRDENLVALCPECHLRYDGYRKAMQRLAKKRIKNAASLPLFT